MTKEKVSEKFKSTRIHIMKVNRRPKGKFLFFPNFVKWNVDIFFTCSYSTCLYAGHFLSSITEGCWGYSPGYYKKELVVAKIIVDVDGNASGEGGKLMYGWDLSRDHCENISMISVIHKYAVWVSVILQLCPSISL